ncbi:ABC transporter ATP-binding protein [Clostridium estertheticum]|uniref:ABC transporter ATP-binding protein n=1 Tax=Clostridium estertheticum TaxID=238834 RepID=UPI001CF2BEA2|nr:ATP-binding cassette domain-containing protein [Clostridium estertheticum]MCB2360859.1 ATP-binding cassette domain-containing protein [Clostridium estertheticum]
MSNIIEVKNATKKFKNKIIFENLSLNIEEGKSYGFIGYNGCGKSVLFKVICGFSLLNSGEILYDNKKIGKDIDFIGDTGIIIETPSFLSDLSGFKNLEIIAEILNKISENEINDVLKLVGLFEDKDKKVSKYSLGMKQKLRIAQAIMEKPAILILDEPMNGLDKKSVEIIRNILKNHVNNGGTLLITSHNADDIEILCENVYEFDDGKILKVK